MNSNVGFAVGDEWDEIVKTTDGGITWTEQSDEQDECYCSIAFTDVNHGIIVGTLGRILKTDDGGTTWSHPSSASTDALSDVKFINATTGYAVGGGGIIE